MSPWSRALGWTAVSFPRVSGDEPEQANAKLEVIKFSPRERG